jgi:ATP-dependent DNA helicase RecQ
MAIQRPENRQPILREEIAIRPKEVAGRTDKENRLIELLQDLDPQHSRAVVFVTSRRLAEDLADLVKLETELSSAPFHAGLSAQVRLETYEQFRDGDLSVLCATKAFGMGMDIDNIHLVIHFGPPFSLEDYIQEIGRAARKRDSLQKANLDKATAHLLYEPGDFDWIRSRLKGGFLSSPDLMELHNLLVAEWKDASSRSDDLQNITIQPGRLAYRLRLGTVNRVRIGLYWLEKLGRIKVGFYTQAQVEVEIDLTHARAARQALSREARDLFDYLQRGLETKTGQYVVHFQARDARTSLGLSTQNQLFVYLAELARRKVIQYRRKLLLPLHERRAQESRAVMDTEEWPLLNAALAAVEKLREDLEVTGLDGLVCRQNELKQQFETLAANHFQPEKFIWLEAPEREEQAQRERRYFPRRVPAVLRLLRGLNIVRVRQEVNSDGLTLYLSQSRREWDQWLDALPALIKESLKNIVTQEQARESSADGDVGEVDAQELLLAVQEAAQPYETETPFSISHLQVILRFLRNLGYLRRADVFVPMALEVWVTEQSPIMLGETSRDAKVLNEFEEQRQLRMLRFAALQAIPIPYLVDDPKKLREFVERYFQAMSSRELLDLLEETLPGESEVLSQLREEALEELLDGKPAEGKPGLSKRQRDVYDAPLDRHLMVVAGPGAGKTHTLLARLVRLVHTENVQASDILVLAFTRAVVSELRYRLQDLLGRLGYGALARGIHVTTFHSFVLRTLRDFNIIQGSIRLDGEDWFEEFEGYLRSNPALHRHVANHYRYVFVDEFQDVHGARYRLLKYLAEGRQTYLLVVGDDDQSIYDYGRMPGEGNAIQYFNDFKDHFEIDDDELFYLTLNYRSAKDIVASSQNVVATLPVRLKENRSLKPYRSAQGVVKWPQAGTDMVALVRNVEQCLNDSQDRRSRHNTIAILARTNADVYRVKAQLQRGLGEKFTLLIQGEESRFIDRRDVAKVMDLLREELDDKPLTQRLLKDSLRRHLSHKRFQHWLRDQPPEQHELWYLSEEFFDGGGSGSMDNFVDYVHALSRNGNYLRVVARRQAADGGKGRILLSTIHKVKGIEFPAVILLNSDMRIKNKDEDIDLELRVMYVGMARAEDVLFVLKGEREERLLERQPFEPADRQQDKLVVAPSLGDVFISKFGYEWETQELIFRRVRRGDSITIIRNEGDKNPFSIRHNDSRKFIGLLSGVNAKKSELTRNLMQRFDITRRFVGLEVTGVYRHYAEQDKRYDEEHSTNFYERLCDEVKNKGYYYIVEIGGLVWPG